MIFVCDCAHEGGVAIWFVCGVCYVGVWGCEEELGG